MDNLITDIGAAVGAAVASLLIAVLTGLVKLVTAKLSQHNRDLLHQALKTGVQVALAKGLSGDRAAGHAVSYAKKSSPKAIKSLGASNDVMTDIAISKINEVKK